MSLQASTPKQSPVSSQTLPTGSQHGCRPSQQFGSDQGAKPKHTGWSKGGRSTKHRKSRDKHSARSHGQSAQTTHSALSHKSPEQQTQSIDTIQQQAQITAAQNSWREDVRKWFPNLSSQTYFLPPLYFSKVSYDVKTVSGQTVLVPQVASNQPIQAPVVVPSSCPPRQTPSPPLASRIWPDKPTPAGPLPVVNDSDTREDRSLKKVLGFLQYLADRRREVMVVVSQLEFRKYLDNKVDPVTTAAILLLPRPVIRGPDDRGEFDVLIVNLKNGLILAEVKSVGADPKKTPDLDRAVVKVTEKAIKQLTKGAGVLCHLVSDLAPITVTKTLVLPYITRTQLQHVLSSRPQLQQALANCLEAPDAAGAVSRCLCQEDIDSPESSEWWQRTVTNHGPDSNMTPELYEILVARFCGPATTIEVPTVTAPRRTVGLKTLSECVALTGLTMSMLTLHLEQVDLLNRPGMPRVFLSGPPGTGKTVVMVLKALQWLRQGKEVHLLSSHRFSRAATYLIEHQLKHAASATAATPSPQIISHFYDFKHNEEDVTDAVDKLSSCAREGELYLIADEAHCYKKIKRKTREITRTQACPLDSECRFLQFCTQLVARVPSVQVHLWAASVASGIITESSGDSCMEEAHMTTPIRCPPVVIREVQACDWINGKSIPKYCISETPCPTDGPDIRWMQHTQPVDESEETSGHRQLVKDHKGESPAHCKLCADCLIRIITELRVDESDENLQYRDICILCNDPSENLPVVLSLREQGIPVKVVRKEDAGAVIRDMVLAVHNAVTVTTWTVVKGLERRVVVGMPSDSGNMKSVDMEWVKNHTRLQGMSRCTSLLVWFS